MKRFVFLSLIIMGALLISGCGEIEEMIEEATERTVTIERTVLDNTKERDVKSVVVAESLELRYGTQPAGAVNVEKLADRIEVSRLGLNDVRFYLEGQLRNKNSNPALVRISIIPNNSGEPIQIGSVTLAGKEELYLHSLEDMDQSYETIHERLKSALHQLDTRYLINPVVQVEGDTDNGVAIYWLKLGAMPVYWMNEVMPSRSLSSYKDNLREIQDATLAGSITNHGEGYALVRLFLGTNEEVDPENDLIAEAMLAPGETRTGLEILVDGGAKKIKSAIKALINGNGLNRNFVIVSDTPLEVEGDNLAIKAKLVVGLDI
ncbi:MAG TPA: hypothetical protein PKW95_16375 [bacterium]|nr:hypothetical protein [bacterium]